MHASEWHRRSSRASSHSQSPARHGISQSLAPSAPPCHEQCDDFLLLQVIRATPFTATTSIAPRSPTLCCTRRPFRDPPALPHCQPPRDARPRGFAWRRPGAPSLSLPRRPPGVTDHRRRASLGSKSENQTTYNIMYSNIKPHLNLRLNLNSDSTQNFKLTNFTKLQGKTPR